MRSPRKRRIFRSSTQPVLRRSATESPRFATEGAAAVLPADTSLAKLLASHILRDGEVVLLILRPSLWFIVLSSLRFVGASLALLIAVRCMLTMPSHATVRTLIELGVSAISSRLMWAMLQWMSRLYILTDMRVVCVSGVFRVAIFDCPLRNVARTRLVRNSQDRATGVGSIEIIPADQTSPFGEWQTIAQPIQIHEKMVATINRAKQGALNSG